MKNFQIANKVALLAGLLLAAACNNEDIPTWNPTGSDETGSGSDGMADGDDSSMIPVQVACWEPDGPQLENPTLFQCVGEAVGGLEYLACKNVLGCVAAAAGTCDYENASDWMVEQFVTDTYSFPPTPPTTAPNAQACCEVDAEPSPLHDGCVADCARAGCNKVIADLQEQLATHLKEPDFGCTKGTDCYNRVTVGLETWIAHIQANYGKCVESATAGEPFYLPNPDTQAALGALACATLKINCTLDEEMSAYDLGETCTTSENDSQAAAGLIYECSFDGDAEASGPEGNAFTSLAGTAVVRQEAGCTGDSCWFSIDRLELEAAGFAEGDYIGREMRASLAYPGFGLVENGSDEGTIAQRMFGLEVTMFGQTPAISSREFAFKIGNSDSAVFKVAGDQFQIIDAYFAWEEHDLTISSDIARCTCVNCPP